MRAMSTMRTMFTCFALLAAGLLTSSPSLALDTNTGESTEIKYSYTNSGDLAYPLGSKAKALAKPVDIYEYVRNNTEFALYHGARSGSVNTILGERGNDVDQAATLIAMLRAQGYAARYAVGTARFPTAKVMNWLKVNNASLAHSILRNMGIQSATISSDSSTISMEHVWVEVQLPYGNYRGAGSSSPNCTATPSACSWVSLDPSFKQHEYRPSGLDPYKSVSFNYDAYYNALKNNDASRRDKNPLEIYENQIATWLQENGGTSGKTLEDIADFGDIVVEENGLLPASLPFITEGTIRRYNSVADHDSGSTAEGVSYVEPKKWRKNVTATIHVNGTATAYKATVDLVTASTQRLSLGFSSDANNHTQAFRLGGQAIPGGALTFPKAGTTINGVAVNIGTPISIHVAMDGAPGADRASQDSTISASYDDSVIGAYYIIATGGPNSNWSQVHRAAKQLIAANQTHSVVINPNDYGMLNGKACTASSTGCQPCIQKTGQFCTPYLDSNKNKVWDNGDSRLLDNQAAMDDLTGGLLYVAATQYLTKGIEAIARLNELGKTKTSVDGFVGLVSSTYNVEYIDGTAFSIQPGGLLIDMKGQTTRGTWRIDQPQEISNPHFKLTGHILSSLEHEIWQELTGYDAISTVRGIQMALAANTDTVLMKPKRSSSVDNQPDYTRFGFSWTLPTGFSTNYRTIFGQTYQTLRHTDSTNKILTMFAPHTQGITDKNDPRRNVVQYQTSYDSSLNYFYTTASPISDYPIELYGLGNSQVHSAEITGSVPFKLDWYSPITSKPGSYNFYFDSEISQPDGNYNIPVNLVFKNGDNGRIVTASFQPQITHFEVITPGFKSGNFGIDHWSNAYASGSSLWFNLLPNGIGDGTHTVQVKAYYRDGRSQQFSLTDPIEVRTSKNISAIVNGRQALTFTVSLNNDVAANCRRFNYSYNPADHLNSLRGCFNAYLNDPSIKPIQEFIKQNVARVYRPVASVSNDDQLTASITKMRDELNSADVTQKSVEYVIPSKMSVGANMRFGVNIRDTLDKDGNLISSGYEIQNEAGSTAGGGYVTGSYALNHYSAYTPARSPSAIGLAGSYKSATPSFNNAVFTNLNTISFTNNHQIRTPSTADPVSTVTGNNYHDETDITIRGRGLDYAFTRTYNSSTAATAIKSSLGYGWVHSYGMKLVANDYGDCPNCTAGSPRTEGIRPENGNGKTASITYTDERGGDHNYLVNEASQVITPPQGEFDSLVLDSPAAGQHTLRFRNGTQYLFETVGTGSLKITPGTTARLLRIADPWGNQLNFSYDGSGRLSTVKDNLGIAHRTGLVFAYDAAGYLNTIKDWGPRAGAARTWTYQVDAASGNLKSYQSPQAMLTAGNSARSMVYDYTPGTHNLTTLTLPLKRQGQAVNTTFSYYENGRTFDYKNSLGEGEALDYDLFRKATRVTDPLGGVRVYDYDDSGRMTRLTEPDGAILDFKNNPDGLRYHKKDALGYPTQYSYRSDKSFNSLSDNGGNVTREQDALSQSIDTSYGPHDQVASVTDKRGRKINTYFYTSTDTPGANACSLAGKPEKTVMETKLTLAVELEGKTWTPLVTYCWHGDGAIKSKTEYTDASNTNRNRKTSYTYTDDSHLNVSSVSVLSSDASQLTSYTWDNLGRNESMTLSRRISPSNVGQLGLTTTTSYDALDRVVMRQDPSGQRILNSYDDNGQLWQIKQQLLQPNSSYTTRTLVTRTYDAADRILTETNAMDGVTRYDYDAAGNVIRVTDPEQHSAEYEYDAMNRRTAVIAANGARTETDYTLRGDVVAVTNANQHSVRRTLDKLGRTLSSTDANGYRTDYRYDANGNLTCTIDANATAGLAPNPKNSDGCTVSHVYDELNRVILSRDAMNGTTQTRYDLLGNILSITDAMGRTTGYQYDGLGRLILSTDPLGKVTRYKRDEAGNAWEMTNRLGEVTRISYDALNRPTRYDYLKDNSADTLHYDPAGNLESQGNATVSYRYRYDALNRMESKQDSRGRSLGFAYDAASQLLAKTTYQNSTTHYRYDSSGTLTGISNPDYLDVHYHYDPAGRLQSRVMSSGATSTYQYDNNGQTTRISHRSANGQGITDISYTRDRVGNILSQTDSSNTGTPTSTPATTNYTYDALYRLIQVDAPGTADDEAWQYDAVGNRLSHTTGGLSINASGSTTRYYNTQPNSNRLVDIRLGSSTGTIESAYQYDDEGRLTRQTGKRPRTLLWDAQGRLASLTQGGHTETYAYDPLDHRIKRSGGSASQASAGMPTGTPSGPLDYYLEGEHLDSVEDANRQPRETYFRGSSIDELVAGYVVNGTTTPNSSSPRSAMLYQHDGTMSVIAISGVNGQLLQSNRYRPFGSSQSQTGSQAGNTANRLQYTGRENDGTGLYYYRARYYDPEAGRFLSEDPLGFAAGDVNFYAYVGNNPVNANDPTGMAAMQIGGAIVGGIGGLAIQAGIDLARGSASSFADYAGALTGGAAGGAAAMTCGPTCAGAAGGAVGSATTQGINYMQGQAVDGWNMLTSTAIGAVGGRLAETVVPYLFKTTLPSMVGTYQANQIKGGIGEGLTKIDLLASGRGISGTQVRNSFGKSTFDFTTSSGTFVEAKFGTAGLNRGAQTNAANHWTSQGAFELQSWSYPKVSGMVGGSVGAGTSGSFTLYPNQPKSNQQQSVYRK